ncbi:hypothetical protein AVEN_9894-1 [Araneus ventricosus]|uniref:Uncharacterized protein n=1 Tax=Araneus ventricosus TaxID=182803 RepID=A0A4Y2RM35_ARAVE|nr:hypothetical protein AVEN_9894-1 [Araneus ventricosus]
MELPDFKDFRSLYSEGDSPMVYRKTDVNRTLWYLNLSSQVEGFKYAKRESMGKMSHSGWDRRLLRRHKSHYPINGSG